MKSKTHCRAEKERRTDCLTKGRWIKMLRIQPMTEKHAEDICQWRYDGIYAVYNLTEDSFHELLNGDYYSCMKGHFLIGFFCFGRSAQIPTAEKDVYKYPALDIGLGLRPELCGKGLGKEFLGAGIQFSRAQILRLSVASFNKRAVNLYRSLGFFKVNEVHHLCSKALFDIMMTTAATGNLPGR